MKIDLLLFIKKNICNYSLELEIQKTLNIFNEKIGINEITSCVCLSVEFRCRIRVLYVM